MLARLFKPRPSLEHGRVLYASLATQARTPAFYADLDVPDTPEGRFELYVLHLALMLRKLKAEGEGASEVSQALFDRFVTSLDDGLREMGVGDLSVGKKMRKLGEALYGRLKAYDAALGAEVGALEDLIRRTVYADHQNTEPGRLAAYADQADAALSGAALDRMLKGDVPWPTP